MLPTPAGEGGQGGRSPGEASLGVAALVKLPAGAVSGAAMRCLACALLLAGASLSPAWAQDGAAPPQVGLDQLLRLPKSYDAGSGERRSGETAVEWRTRFATATQQLETAREALRRAQAELESAVGEVSSWQVSAPGGGQSEVGPANFAARAKVKKKRADVERAERKLRELEVEADLADVPAGWRLVAPQAE